MEAEEKVRKCRRVGYRVDPLWRRLSYMKIEPVGTVLTFGQRLAREQGWAPAFAEAVVGEYRRFLYLAGVSGTEVSPSPAVDRAWHLHLTYSRHYWSELCGKVLRRELHHVPSRGSADEAARLRTQYADTLVLYERTFGSRPPPNIWPSVDERFPERERFETDLPPLIAAAVALTIAAATLLGAGPPSTDVPLLRMWIFMAAITAFFIAIWTIPRERFRAEIGCGGGFFDGMSDLGCGGGGCGGCGG